MRMRQIGFLLGTLVVAAVVFAGSMVDQGKPGTQGAWPVSLTGGTWTPDGGYIGSVSVVTFDGGSIGSVTTNSGWEKIASFDLARVYTDQGVALNESAAGNNDLTSDYTGGTASSLWVWSPQFYVAAPFSTEVHMPLVPFWTFFFSASTATVTNVAYGQVDLWGLH